MQEPTPQQNKMLRLAKLVDKQEVGIAEELNTLDEKILSIEEKANEALKVAEETQKMEGQAGHTPTEDELLNIIKPLIPEPIKGDDYVLTEEDKQQIASTIKVPVVEKIIEKTEVIKEIPIVTNEIKEVALDEKPEAIRDKLETLKEDNRLDVSAIKGIDNVKLSNEIVDRAIGIVDQRTSFLINKVSNLKDQVDRIPPPTITATGGVKSWFFTKDASNVVGMYNATITFPDDPLQTIVATANDGETTIAEFITEPQTEGYAVLDGSRFFYFTAKVSNLSKITQLRGEVWTCDATGGSQVLLRTSTLTTPLTLVDAEYSVSVYGGSLYIPTTTRIIFKIISVKEAGGTLPDVTLSVNDDTFSRLDVPSPVGVTDLSMYVGKSFETYNKNLESYPYEIAETSSTITTITYDVPSGDIIKTITEVSPTVTTISLTNLPVGLPTTKTITEGLTTVITYA